MPPFTSRTGAFLALLLLCTSSIATGRKLRPGVSARIFNGTAAGKDESAEFGFIVAFYRTPNSPEEALTKTPFCTGTLITSNVVLTAAHCFYGDGAFLADTADSVSVRIEGEWDRIIPLSDIQLHPSYEHASDSSEVEAAPYDVAVVQLSEDATVAPAGGAVSTSYQLTDLQELLIAGYGLTNQTVDGAEGGTSSTNVMHYAFVNYLADRCPTLFEGTICAGGYANTCQGDSGGPLLTLDPETDLWIVLGVTSYGPLCGKAAAEGIPEFGEYTDVRILFEDINTMIAMLPSRDSSPSAAPAPSPA